MHAAEHQIRATPDIALIFFTPSNQFEVPIGRLFHTLIFFDDPFQIAFLIMFRVVSRCARQRHFHSARMQKVAMRSFASAIEPMLFQIGDELPNLSRHTEIITIKSNGKLEAADQPAVQNQAELATVSGLMVKP